MFNYNEISNCHHVFAMTFDNGYTVSIAGGRGSMYSNNGSTPGEYTSMEVVVFDKNNSTYCMPGTFNDGVYAYCSTDKVAAIIAEVAALPKH